MCGFTDCYNSKARYSLSALLPHQDYGFSWWGFFNARVAKVAKAIMPNSVAPLNVQQTDATQVKMKARMASLDI